MTPVCQKYAGWEEARRDFTWDLPDRLNMATEVCDRWAETCPNRAAIVEPRTSGVHTTTYGILRAMADALAHELTARGVKRGDRVGIYRSQSPWTAAAHIAIWKIGAISLPLFVLFGPEAVTERLDDSGTRLVISDVEGAERLKSWAESSVDVVVPDDMPLTGTPFATADTAPDDPAVLIYTSGTTGGPKGALHGHRVLRGHLPGVEMSHDLFPEPEDVLWTPADWAWIGGLFDVLMPGLWHGVPVVAARMTKFSAEECMRIIQEASVKNTFFPPTALRAIKAADVRIPDLRSVASGGEPLGAEMLAWGRKAFGLDINEFYGQTECNMVLSNCGAWFTAASGSTGRPVPGHDVAVIDENGNATSEEGDIAVRRGSASMFLSYWNNPDATRAKFRGDWLLTGDRGRQAGLAIQFVGREDDVITSSGYRIGPGEIEDCLMTHPAVASVGVVGLPDPERTERVAAFVVLKQDYMAGNETATALKLHVRERLAAHEYPRDVTFVSSLPMTVTGKVMRRELKAWAMLGGDKA